MAIERIEEFVVERSSFYSDNRSVAHLDCVGANRFLTITSEATDDTLPVTVTFVPDTRTSWHTPEGPNSQT